MMSSRGRCLKQVGWTSALNFNLNTRNFHELLNADSPFLLYLMFQNILQFFKLPACCHITGVMHRHQYQQSRHTSALLSKTCWKTAASSKRQTLNQLSASYLEISRCRNEAVKLMSTDVSWAMYQDTPA